MADKWTPTNDLAKTVYAVGFKYDDAQDILVSRKGAPQREFGYAYVYDAVAPLTISAVIDCEPFFFPYNKRHWMIELWKGQYGLETGCEVGAYVASKPRLDKTLGFRPHDRKHSRFYDCVDDKDMLDISFTLLKNGTPLFHRGPKKHWWLTGFRWGELSSPDELTMDVSIGFPDTGMCAAFAKSLRKTGYEYSVTEDKKTAKFRFDKPKTHQPRLDPDNKTIVDEANAFNKGIVKKYNGEHHGKNDPNHISGSVKKDLIDYFVRREPKALFTIVENELKKLIEKYEESFLEFWIRVVIEFFARFKR